MYKNSYVGITILFFLFNNAFAVTVPNSSVSTFSPEQRSSRTESVWLRPYNSFETIDLENKTKVHNTGYGTYVGYDTNIIQLNPNWDAVFTFHTGYTGSRQGYKSRTILQNGGQIGISGVFFKKNLFIGILANVGATDAKTQSPDGEINFSMLSTTGAVKTGYNFSFIDQKLVLQPSFLFGYLFVNTLDYVNLENVLIKSEPVHSIQLVPGCKLTMNLQNGLQAYFGVQTVWNLMNESNFSPNDVSVGEISVKPYAQYGLGLQKAFGDNYSGYIQSTFRNGGRNGIILSFGLRMYF